MKEHHVSDYVIVSNGEHTITVHRVDVPELIKTGYAIVSNKPDKTVSKPLDQAEIETEVMAKTRKKQF